MLLRLRESNGLRVYRCDICKAWHLTSKKHQQAAEILNDEEREEFWRKARESAAEVTTWPAWRRLETTYRKG